MHMHRNLYWTLALSFFLFSHQLSANSNLSTALCAATKCTGKLLRCMMNDQCRETLNCNKKCGASGSKADQQACHLVCQLDTGKDNVPYEQFVNCSVKNKCLPTLPEGVDGVCPVNESNISNVYQLNQMADIEGTWLEIQGRNCGVKGSKWEGGYDALQCRSSSWLYEENNWWYHTAFCKPGSGDSCKGTNPVHLIAQPSINNENPYLLDVHYINPPLKPQEEKWYVLARPHPDWLMYTYCGSTPVGTYAGINIITRSPRPWESGIPQDVEKEFKKKADLFDIEYDKMCSANHSNCPQVNAQDDLERWLESSH